MLISKFHTLNVEEHIREIEDKYSIKIPVDYKQFLLTYNGGITVKTNFQIHNISSDIVGFYGLGDVDRKYHFKQFETMGMIEEYIGNCETSSQS